MKIEVMAKRVLVKHEDSEVPYEQIRFEKDLTVFRAPMFFEVGDDEVVLKEIKNTKLQASTDEELIEKIVDFYMQNAKYVNKDTVKTMRSWQYVNGFTNTKLVNLTAC
jgi:hypothetical protein